MKLKLGSTRAALLIITYNCLVVPVIAFALVFVWRVSIGSIYGYAKYDPINPVLFWLLVAVAAEIIFVAKVAEVKNIRGILVGFRRLAFAVTRGAYGYMVLNHVG